MGERTKIEWTHHTWNPWRGCEHATLPDGTPHPGCANCYAESMAKRNPRTLGTWGEYGTRIRAVDKTFKLPLEWDRKAKEAGEVRRVFVDSLSDFFEDWKGPVTHHLGGYLHRSTDGYCVLPDVNEQRAVRLDDLRADAYRIIDQCRNLRFLILTKRPQNVRQKRFWNPVQGQANIVFRSNVWLLASVSDQPSAQAMIPPLLKCRDLVPVLGVSAEPLLGPIDLSYIPIAADVRADVLRGIYTQWCDEGVDHPAVEQEFDGGPHLDLVIPGGESGPGARPCNIDWIRDIVRQCREADVACFVKQLGANVVDSNPGASVGVQQGRLSAVRWALRDAKGGDWDEWPADLRIRQFPVVEVS